MRIGSRVVVMVESEEDLLRWAPVCGAIIAGGTLFGMRGAIYLSLCYVFLFLV